MDYKQFYAYVWLNGEGEPYYVGKGFGDRAYCHPTGDVLPPSDRSSVLIYPCDNEDEAFDLEKEFILRYGRLDLATGSLENRTWGGEGKSGARASKGHGGVRIRLAKAPDVIATEEDLYYVMQCAAKAALCRFENYTMETNELANELYIRWKLTGLEPSHRRPTYRGNPTNPAKGIKLPIKKHEAYYILRADFVNILNKERRHVKRSVPMSEQDSM
jgi:hypothetical protein